MSIEAMKLALEALEYHQEQTRPIHKTQETITALRKAIEQAEKQEPVAWVAYGFGKEKHNLDYAQEDVDALEIGTPLYTALPKREWVSLTDEEIDYLEDAIDPAMYRVFARRIEAKLKEKNHD